jgi:hypothetical protein
MANHVPEQLLQILDVLEVAIAPFQISVLPARMAMKISAHRSIKSLVYIQKQNQ